MPTKFPIVGIRSGPYRFQGENKALRNVDLVKGAKAARKFIALQERAQEETLPPSGEEGVMANGGPVVEEKKPEGAFATLVSGITKPVEKLGTSSRSSRHPRTDMSRSSHRILNAPSDSTRNALLLTQRGRESKGRRRVPTRRISPRRFQTSSPPSTPRSIPYRSRQSKTAWIIWASRCESTAVRCLACWIEICEGEGVYVRLRSFRSGNRKGS